MFIRDFPEIELMYVKSKTGIAGATSAFNILEAKLPTLKRRKFHGLVFSGPPNEEYWACVAVIERDQPEKMGLETYTIPGGKYVQEKIVDWSKNLQQIGETFQTLASQYRVDSTRPSIEYSSSMKEVLICLPIK